MSAPDPECSCGGVLKRVIIGGTGLNPLHSTHSVVGDECDVTVTNGICNLDGTPRRYTSKSEMATEAAKRGLTNHVEHIPGKGSDKSRHTSRWV